MRILKKGITIDEIEAEVINIKREGNAQVIEDRKIRELLTTYYYDQKDLKLQAMAKTLTKNVSYILERRNMTMRDLSDEFTRKTGLVDAPYRSKTVLNVQYYRNDNIFNIAMDFAFALNVSPWDLLFHDVEYLMKKNMLGTF